MQSGLWSQPAISSTHAIGAWKAGKGASLQHCTGRGMQSTTQTDRSTNAEAHGHVAIAYILRLKKLGEKVCARKGPAFIHIGKNIWLCVMLTTANHLSGSFALHWHKERKFGVSEGTAYPAPHYAHLCRKKAGWQGRGKEDTLTALRDCAAYPQHRITTFLEATRISAADLNHVWTVSLHLPSW